MTALLYAIFFASGAAALVFEMLWFRQAGLALGNSVWASSLVLSGFMAGLAIGNAAAARHGTRPANAVRAYAIAEVAIATTGVALVYLLPLIGGVLAPLLRPLLDRPGLLNSIRLVIAFVLLLVPSTAMGITLPLLTRALAADERRFGPALGRLYGWNTLGAMVGVLAGEMYLVGALGVRGTALAAGGVNLLAAAAAMWISSRLRVQADRKVGLHEHAASRRRPDAAPWLVAAFLSGFCLLALEVVWFRFLLLFVKGHSAALALILALILAGIALGGLAAAAWLRAAPDAHRLAAPVAFIAGAACVVSYTAFPAIVESSASLIVDPPDVVRVAAPLVLPVSFLSGVLFTLLGAALRTRFASESAAAGVLTLANTSGAAFGSLAAGFLLLPLLGIERSLCFAAVLYAFVGLLLAWKYGAARRAGYASAATLVAALVLFPFGTMETRLLDVVIRPWRQADPDARIVAVREGLTETVIYFERAMLGRPVSHAMLTNAFSMSATGYGARRYMKLYVYWPMAVHRDLRRALLIGYGVGNTAKAMTDSRTLESIDIVDLSRDILEMNRVVYPEPSELPLNDPRVRVHVEDGRYLLQATDREFDLITGEPPPPGIAGVENLYTREYFQLLRSRLAEGGIVTYWLPLSDLSEVSSKTVLRAFCDVFDDCSLWNGSGTHLMMAGTRDARRAQTEEAFAGQWADPKVAAEMTRLGLERPEQLGALFIGDAEYLRQLIGDSPALTDDDPKLIEAPPSSPAERARFVRTLADTSAARARFASSPFIARVWPERIRAASSAFFDVQAAINAHMYGELLPGSNAIQDVHRVLTTSELKAPVLWRLGSNDDIQRVVSAMPAEWTNPPVQFHLGVRQLSERQYSAAAESFAGAAPTDNDAFALQVYALCMAGRIADAQELIRAPWQESLRQRGIDAATASGEPLPAFWMWMKETFGIDPRT